MHSIYSGRHVCTGTEGSGFNKISKDRAGHLCDHPVGIGGLISKEWHTYNRLPMIDGLHRARTCLSTSRQSWCDKCASSTVPLL